MYFEVLLSDLLFFYGKYEPFFINILFWKTIITFIIKCQQQPVVCCFK